MVLIQLFPARILNVGPVLMVGTKQQFVPSFADQRFPHIWRTPRSALFLRAAAFRIRRVSWSQSLARLTLTSKYVHLNTNACGTPSRCTGTTHCGNTRCRIRACGNESRTRPTRVAHLCFAPPLPERQRYEERKAPRDDGPADFQYCLREMGVGVDVDSQRAWSYRPGFRLTKCRVVDVHVINDPIKKHNSRSPS